MAAGAARRQSGIPSRLSSGFAGTVLLDYASWTGGPRGRRRPMHGCGMPKDPPEQESDDDAQIPAVDQRELRRKLFEKRSEHRDLDDVIARLGEEAPFDQLQLQRLKKRKLMLKDEISRLEDQLLPDIIA